MFDSIFARAFRTEHVIHAAYPRWDAFQNQNLCLPKEQKYWNRIQSFRSKRPQGKVLVYMPTFRDSEERLLGYIDVKEMQNFLKEHDLMLVIKLHPKSKVKEVVARQLHGCSKRIVLVDTQYDSNLFLTEADVLITDYSSCYFDYLKLNRPIVYFDYDYDEYVTQSRELYFDYDEMTAGIKVQNVQQLKDAIVQSISDTKIFETDRNRIREQLYGESV
jgi:CDP-glycerol glycerophosphotransferase (TagB/SpsB family)